MSEQELIKKAEAVPFYRWWEIEGLIEIADSDELKSKLYWIMRKKELREQLSSSL